MDSHKKIWRLALAGYGVGLAALVMMSLVWGSAAFKYSSRLMFVPFLIGAGCDLRFEHLRIKAGLRKKWEWFHDPFELFDPLPQYPEIDFMRKLVVLSLGVTVLYFCMLFILLMLR